MQSEQMLMELGASELRRCENTVPTDWIATSPTESTMGKVHHMELVCAVENRRATRQRGV
jgi:hypothetical protein